VGCGRGAARLRDHSLFWVTARLEAGACRIRQRSWWRWAPRDPRGHWCRRVDRSGQAGLRAPPAGLVTPLGPGNSTWTGKLHLDRETPLGPGNSTWTGKLHLDCLRTRLRRSNRTQAVHRHVGGPSVRRPARPRQWPARAARRFACCDDGPSLGAGASLLVATVRGVGARTDAVPDEPPSPPTTTAHPNRAPPDNPITSASITRQPGGDPQLVPTHPPKHDVSPTTHRWLGRRWS